MLLFLQLLLSEVIDYVDNALQAELVVAQPQVIDERVQVIAAFLLQIFECFALVQLHRERRALIHRQNRYQELPLAEADAHVEVITADFLELVVDFVAVDFICHRVRVLPRLTVVRIVVGRVDVVHEGAVLDAGFRAPVAD